jgi:hypothetical protein
MENVLDYSNGKYLSIEMQMRMLLERKSPKIRKKERIRQRTSPASHITVAAQAISSGIIMNVTYVEKIPILTSLM